jgi:hypothetical protein
MLTQGLTRSGSKAQRQGVLAVVRAVLILVNVTPSSVPREVRTATRITAINAAIKAYSIMVTPFWSRPNLLN